MGRRRERCSDRVVFLLLIEEDREPVVRRGITREL
jgi:hypothetical protein